MTITERIAAAVKPIIDDHNRESRERIGQLERDIDEARAHLEVARTTCERLTKQAPQTQQDGPWCVIAVDRMPAQGDGLGRLYPVVYEGPCADQWGEDTAHVVLSRRVADDLRERLHRDAPAELDNMRVVSVTEWVAIYTRANGPVTK
jgi:hypothetical protein